MCTGNQEHDFHSKTFIEVPESFQNICQLNGIDYEEILNAYMSRYSHALQNTLQAQLPLQNEE